MSDSFSKTAVQRGASGDLWDAEQTRALLNLPFAKGRPAKTLADLLADPALARWLAARGGPEGVYRYLRSLALPPAQRLLLAEFLANPGDTMANYIARLDIPETSYYRRLKELLDSLTQHLNLWNVSVPASVPESAEARPRPSLSQPLSSFVGRARERAHLSNLLQSPDVRLVTVMGVGGVGKTRIALQLAQELRPLFADGVYPVALASLSDPELVLPMIAQTLGLGEAEGAPAFDRLVAALREKRLLLVLDNLEQVIAVAPSLGELLRETVALRILVTSREQLGIYGEHCFLLQPLEVPALNRQPTTESLAANDAVRLFLDRAVAARPDLALDAANVETIAAICVRLEGLPLAIELAASRLALFAPSELLSRLADRFALLTSRSRDLPARHQTLRNTIDWSYQLLDDAERLLFRRLAIFVGGWTLSAARAVYTLAGSSSADLLSGVESLLAKSMIQHELGAAGQGEPRFGMLEALRDYALAVLEAQDELAALQQAHYSYLRALAEQSERELTGSAQASWLDALEREHDNFRAALAWALEREDPSAALGLAAALWRFWFMRDHLSEGRAWLERVLALPSDTDSVPLRARALEGLGVLMLQQSAYKQALPALHESLAFHKQAGDRAGIAAVLGRLGILYEWYGELEQARAHYQQSLALYQELDDQRGIAVSLANLGTTLVELDRQDEGVACYQEALQRFRQLGDQRNVAANITNIGMSALEQRNFGEARQAFEEGLRLFSELKHRRGIASLRCNLARVLIYQRDLSRARKLLAESLLLSQELDVEELIVEVLEGYAALCQASGQSFEAATLLGAAEHLRELCGVPVGRAQQPLHSQLLERVSADLGDVVRALAWGSGRAMSRAQAISCALALRP